MLLPKTLPCRTSDEWSIACETIRARRYGVIETAASGLRAVHLRPWPKLFSLSEFIPMQDRYHARGKSDCCLLYYNQPLLHSNYLALKYVVSTRATSYVTFLAALRTLDAIAKLKASDAILCDALNQRISDRLLRRLGWEAHKPQRWHRNFIKRFYGEYPPIVLPFVS